VEYVIYQNQLEYHLLGMFNELCSIEVWRISNAVVMVSQDSRSTRYNYNGSHKSRVVVCFF
jgi:hypothetical protein